MAAEQVVQQTSDKILERADAVGTWIANALDSLAQKLGTTVEYLWPTFVREQFSFGLSLAVGAVLFIALAITINTVFRKRALAAYERGDGDASAGYTAFSWILLLIGMITGIVMIIHAIPYLVAPEPAALREIANTLRNFR
jgi:hypothetical protein